MAASPLVVFFTRLLTHLSSGKGNVLAFAKRQNILLTAALLFGVASSVLLNVTLRRWIDADGHRSSARSRGAFPFSKNTSEIHLISQWYNDADPARQAELMTAICLNLRNEYITTYHFLQGPMKDQLDGNGWASPYAHLRQHCDISPKEFLAKTRFYPEIVGIEHDNKHKEGKARPDERAMLMNDLAKDRLTAQQAFRFASRYLPGRISILLNLDISFDASVHLLRFDPNLSFSSAYFLSRYEPDDVHAQRHQCAQTELARRRQDAIASSSKSASERGSLGIGTQCGPGYIGSHDSVVFVPPLPRALISQSPWPLGTPGIENRLMHTFRTVGLSVGNPCRDIKSWHHHGSAVRNDILPVVNVNKKSAIEPPSRLLYRPEKMAADGLF